MKISGINKYYEKRYKDLKIAQGYLEIFKFDEILKSCRLKPFGKNYKILQDKWIDEFGNSLNIEKKKLKIKLNDLNICNSNNTDIYSGLEFKKILKISKFLYIYLDEEIIFLSCLGIDDFFRSFLMFDDEFINVSPLYGGMEYLINFYGTTFPNIFKKAVGINGLKGDAWITALPISNDFIRMILMKSNGKLDLK